MKFYSVSELFLSSNKINFSFFFPLISNSSLFGLGTLILNLFSLYCKFLSVLASSKKTLPVWLISINLSNCNSLLLESSSSSLFLFSKLLLIFEILETSIDWLIVIWSFEADSNWLKEIVSDWSDIFFLFFFFFIFFFFLFLFLFFFFFFDKLKRLFYL